MLRSLYSGISGLRNHQLKMDVTSNNIANVNTTGYKSQRISFKEGYSQLLSGSSRPVGNVGGINPMQVGLGMEVGSIDSMMIQGHFQSTGQITDLAIDGNAFFAFNNHEGGTYYSRNGSLQINADGYLVSSTNGFGLQGLTADSYGNISGTATVDNIRIPYNEKAPAKATEQVGFKCNLDSDSVGLGTWTHSARFLNNAPNDTLLTALFDGSGNDLNMKVGDILRITYSDPATGEQNSDFVVQDTSELSDLATEIQNVLGATAMVTVDADGHLSIGGTTNATNLVVKNTTRPTSNSFVANLFQWSGAVAGTDSIGKALAPAKSDTLMSDVYDARGERLGLEDGDTISVGATIGGKALSADPGLTYTATITMGDLLDHMQQRFRLPDYTTTGDGSTAQSIELNDSSLGDERAPLGSIVIRGQAGLDFALSGISITGNNSDNDAMTPSGFNANMTATEFQAARDTTVHAASIEVYDDSGDAHTMTTTFTHSGTLNKWLWEISLHDGEQIFGGNTGTVNFAEDGSPSSWLFDDDQTEFVFNPGNGSGDVRIDLETGMLHNFDGITQFRSPTTTAAVSQDGYTMGILEEISISENGEINGEYTNGTNRVIAQILLADFNNPAGLLRSGDSMWSESNNSGEGVLRAAGTGTSSKIKPGALEMSRVDLAEEFTDLITTQRAYQANARVITTSDELLQELVQLVR